jgi:hypothetical protein
METEFILNLAIIAWTIGAMVVVNNFLYRKPITEEQIAVHEIELEKVKIFWQQRGFELIVNARQDLENSRRFWKGLILVFLGVILFAGLLGMIFLSLAFASVMCIGLLSVLYLILYGFWTLAGRFRFMAVAFAMMFAISFFLLAIFSSLIKMDPVNYLYLVGVVVILFITRLFVRKK